MSHVQIPVPDTLKASVPSQEQQENRHSMTDQAEASVGSKTNDSGWPEARGSYLPQDQPPHARMTNGRPEHQSRTSRRPSTRVVSPAILSDSIEAQFGLEILLKHKELRLIDQEFARCQVALEQLRRCQIIPYPAMSSTFEDIQAASSGSGAAFDNRAPYASPWGVAQGPYTRHYQRWLIPDSAFDDTVADVQTPTPRGKTLPDRATRGSKSEIGSIAGTSRSQRGSTNTRLKALPHGYPEPKEEKGPCIVRRPRDGKMVKLVCLDCRRSDFSSAQGFINHCRIAHSRQFLSHDAAIEASGEEVDAETEGSAAQVSSGAQATASAGLVHPLIRSAYSLQTNGASAEPTTSSRRKKSQATTAPATQISTTQTLPQAMSTPQQTRPAPNAEQRETAQSRSTGGVLRGGELPERARSTSPSEPSPSIHSVPFNPSPQTPHLSTLLARMGRGGDLDQAVTEATTRVDFGDEEDLEELEVTPEQPEAPQSRSTRGVLRGGELPERARSVLPSEPSPSIPDPPKLLSQRPLHLPSITAHAPYQTPHHADHEESGDQDIPMLDHQSPFNLSPNTIESHTAPSLVSDDGDYENTLSESESPSDAEGEADEDHYVHAEFMDHDDMDLAEGSSDHHLGLGGKPHGPNPGRRSSSMRPPTAIHNEERHVSFASPQRRQRRGSKAEDVH